LGALQFLPEGDEPASAGIIDARAVTDKEIADVVRNLSRNPLGVGGDAEFRISLAGAQEKTALLYWQNQWHIPRGTTATTHILKPQIGKLPNGMDLSRSVENEHLCLEIAAGLGLPTAKSAIADFDGTRVLVIERFDRRWTKGARLLRLPQEDCCQALSVPPSRKYQADGGPGMVDLLKLLKSSDEPEKDQATLVKAQILFWLLGATDGHAKNFSLWLSPGGRFRLTPLHDIVSLQPVADAGQVPKTRMKLAMSVGNNRYYTVHTIVGRHFLETAHRAQISRKIAETVIAELVESAQDRIDQVAARLPRGFPEEIVASVTTAVARRLKTLATTITASN
jgi:serine/threonine-protein kinase HipA